MDLSSDTGAVLEGNTSAYQIKTLNRTARELHGIIDFEFLFLYEAFGISGADQIAVLPSPDFHIVEYVSRWRIYLADSRFFLELCFVAGDRIAFALKLLGYIDYDIMFDIVKR